MLIRGLSPSSRLSRSVNGPAAAWGPLEHLTATAVDLLAGANWQRAGGKGQRPKQVQRPQRPRSAAEPQDRPSGRSSGLAFFARSVIYVPEG